MKPLFNLMLLPLDLMHTTLQSFSPYRATPISALKVPEPVTIEAQVIEIRDDEIVVRDKSGQIIVDMDHINVKAAKFKLREKLLISGYLDIDRDFDCYEILREDGTTLKAVVS